MIVRRVLALLAPAIAAGAFCLSAAAQQPVPRDTTRARRDTTAADTTGRRAQPGDTLRADSTRAGAAPADSARADTVRAAPRDTIKAPLARAPMPPLTDVGAPYRWDRTDFFNSGAITLGDLLERVPGLTRFRPGWLSGPETAAMIGDMTRVRVFYDGVELDALNPRDGGLLDLSQVQLWTLEEVAVERGADEIRVYIRSWRVDRTTTNTRTDVLTGDESTNLYRGFFGRRFRHGEALQLAAQQYGYDARNDQLGGGDQLSVLARVGWARRGWSVDAFAIRSSGTRDPQIRFDGVGDPITRLKSTRTDAYLRAALGDPEQGSWVQLTAASLRFDEKTPQVAGTDEADTTRSITQYIAAAGTNAGPFRLSATGRAHVLHGETQTSIAGRAALETRLLALSLYTEQRSGDTSSVEEASARFTPLSWLALSGAVARRHGGRDAAPDVLSARGELGLRLGRFWASGGVMAKDTSPVLPAAVPFDTAYAALPDASRPIGWFGTVRGRLWRDFYADLWGVRWDERGWYRPREQFRAELSLNTNWLSRFPSGNFQFLGSVAWEYRGSVVFPRNDGTVDFTTNLHQLRSLVQIRILDGYLFWQQYLRVQPALPTVVPGFVLQRQLTVFGARWQFWN
ncbi:MAG TPA: Plug domain-containing protein [Gemmatimonadaceae bacterium]|nr:Plug domain-containing protein [Gemmatimonadaceae bacterium]